VDSECILLLLLYIYILFSFEHGALYYLHSFILTIISFFIYYKWHGNNFEL
jgi:hypothetical protein